MNRILFTTAVLLGTLSGCSSTVVPAKVEPNGEYIGWHCSGDIASEGNWRCEEKTLKNGKVVSTAVPPPAADPAALSLQEPIQEPAPSLVIEAAPADIQSYFPTTGYSLQLGAYASREQAQDAAANMLFSSTLEVRDIISQGRAFSVILMGHYQTH